MTTVRLTQLDGKLPNLALMSLAYHHRQRGDEVRFYRSPYKHLDEPAYDRVYGSAIFKFSHRHTSALLTEFPDAIIGGTGTDTWRTVGDVLGEDPVGVDYSLYPKFTGSIGFTQRGCRLSCKFCVVPRKEGKPRSVNTVHEIWRGDPHPKHIHLLDNDFFGQPEWQDRINEIRAGKFQVCFNQGINVRAVTDQVAEALASVQFRDDQFKRRRLYTAWDNLKDESVFFRGVDMLEARGVTPSCLMAFMLIGFDKNETWDRIFHRFHRMVDRGIKPYPMVYGDRPDLKRFQRWVVTGIYRAGVTFSEYDVSARGRRPDGQDDLFAA